MAASSSRTTDASVTVLTSDPFPLNFRRTIGSASLYPELLGPEFFLRSNTDQYISYLIPQAQRGTIEFAPEGCRLRLMESELWLSTRPPEATLAGLAITAFYLPPSHHFWNVNIPALITDTTASLLDPLGDDFFNMVTFQFNITSRERLAEEVQRQYGDQFLLAFLSTYSINIGEWGNRITPIWNGRIRMPYPVCGIRFYNRIARKAYDWYDVIQIADREDRLLTIRPLENPAEVINGSFQVMPRVVTMKTLYGADTLVLEWFCARLLRSMISQSIDPGPTDLNPIQIRELRAIPPDDLDGIIYQPRTPDELLNYCFNTILVSPRQQAALLGVAQQYGLLFRTYGQSIAAS